MSVVVWVEFQLKWNKINVTKTKFVAPFSIFVVVFLGEFFLIAVIFHYSLFVYITGKNAIGSVPNISRVFILVAVQMQGNIH